MPATAVLTHTGFASMYHSQAITPSATYVSALSRHATA